MIYLNICIWLCNITAFFITWVRKDRVAGCGWFVVGNSICVIPDSISRQWAILALNVFAGLVSLFFWWRGRRDKRRRAAALVGAKSRALRDALVRRMAGERRPVPDV